MLIPSRCQPRLIRSSDGNQMPPSPERVACPKGAKDAREDGKTKE